SLCMIRPCGCDLLLFFFQAEDGIRDLYVTGVQTCALPISWPALGHAAEIGFANADHAASDSDLAALHGDPRFDAIVEDMRALEQIGRASCRERVGIAWGARRSPEKSPTSDNCVRAHVGYVR